MQNGYGRYYNTTMAKLFNQRTLSLRIGDNGYLIWRSVFMSAILYFQHAFTTNQNKGIYLIETSVFSYTFYLLELRDQHRSKNKYSK